VEEVGWRWPCSRVWTIAVVATGAGHARGDEVDLSLQSVDGVGEDVNGGEVGP
jgi:hypothetical protein